MTRVSFTVIVSQKMPKCEIRVTTNKNILIQSKINEKNIIEGR